MKLVGIDSVLYTTSQAVIYSKLSLCYRLLSNIGTPARWISRFSMAGQQSRMVYVGSDGAVRLVSPINGKTISIIYPIIEHDMINTVHDPQEDASYSSLSNGNVMVFSTATNPCRFVGNYFITFIAVYSTNTIRILKKCKATFFKLFIQHRYMFELQKSYSSLVLSLYYYCYCILLYCMYCNTIVIL